MGGGENDVSVGELTRTVQRLEGAFNAAFLELKNDLVTRAVYKAEKETTDLRIGNLEKSKNRLISATTGLALVVIGDVLRNLLHVGVKP